MAARLEEEEVVLVATCSTVAQVAALWGQESEDPPCPRIRKYSLSLSCTSSLSNSQVAMKFQRTTVEDVDSAESVGGYREMGAAMEMLPLIKCKAIVTTDSLFLVAEVRPGYSSDSKCRKYSVIRRTLYNTIPAGTHFIGDAGYVLLPGFVVPCDEPEVGDSLSYRQRTLNFRRSRTQIPVESAFGIWKGRIRMLQGVMSQETPHASADFVVATVVLDNLMVFYRNSASIPRFVEDEVDVINTDEIQDARQREIGKI
ncbi:hypothetical protein ON010_g7085 [Phytophthora cinnamomi]|nr:hypothetical protein ON010_g7085 [Phytophthora cinnamomi]